METYVAIDLETTGLSPKTDKIIEIGAVRVVNGKITDRLQLFADPGRLIPQRITDRHTVDFCGDAPLLGHNILFDYSFLKQSAVNAKITFEHTGIDTLKIARKFLADQESRRLEALCAYYHIAVGHHHRAVDDAIAAKCLYDCLRQQFGEGNEASFEPGSLCYHAKREGPVTPAQKRYLNDLIKYHKIEIDYAVEKLTKNEASRKIDQILSVYGRIRQTQ